MKLMAYVSAAVLSVGFALSEGRAHVLDLEPGHLSGGAALGFLGNTPDRGADFALKGHVDYSIARSLSVGPLVQYAGSGSQFIFGLTGMVKYWWDLAAADPRLQLVTQAGIGFARLGVGDIRPGGAIGTDASFLLPLGVGLDYALTSTTALTVDFLLNFTSLGARDTHTNVMPGLYFGVRF